MKSFILVVNLFLITSPIRAQTRPPCRDACITLYNPVCGETLIKGKVLRCEFGNSCFMAASSCVHRINWHQTDLDSCRPAQNTEKCNKYKM
ncbi:uncharacterized protein Dana_GF27543 [Drosophila ananassae]|uniref:Kazal-like domain-containing protein n=1 Tax=Drosophila ananassae TaxID=7217 RepID=A0A0P9A139_DROAN|nr:uncharacterized protein Dana_GF27543 [Drosophila ananassae]